MVEPKEQVGYCAQVPRAGGTDTRLGGSEMFRHIYHKKRWRGERINARLRISGIYDFDGNDRPGVGSRGRSEE